MKHANREGATVRYPAPTHMQSCMRVVQPAAMSTAIVEDMLDGAVATEHDGGRRDTRTPVWAETRQNIHGGQGNSPARRPPAGDEPANIHVECAEGKPVENDGARRRPAVRPVGVLCCRAHAVHQRRPMLLWTWLRRRAGTERRLLRGSAGAALPRLRSAGCLRDPPSTGRARGGCVGGQAEGTEPEDAGGRAESRRGRGPGPRG